MTDPVVYQLPSDYQQVYHLQLLEKGKYLLINLLALIPLVISLIVMGLWWGLVLRVRGSVPGGLGADWPWWFWLIAIFVLIVVIHEGLHGLAIRWAGHKPRFGMILSKGAFYATADGAYFWRNDFVVIALAPIVVMTLAGMLLVWLLPDTAGYYVALGVVLNAANAIGDLWMTVVVLHFPASVLVQDEADSIRIFAKP
ncbi:MAG: DUF3267 domain-containing protein [Anaerolineae bacterium]|nr:DUF3267 domain-containing protein [Anaerolineae bacterium]